VVATRTRPAEPFDVAPGGKIVQLAAREARQNAFKRAFRHALAVDADVVTFAVLVGLALTGRRDALAVLANLAFLTIIVGGAACGSRHAFPVLADLAGRAIGVRCTFVCGRCGRRRLLTGDAREEQARPEYGEQGNGKPGNTSFLLHRLSLQQESRTDL
jgi:hypothetical protein